MYITHDEFINIIEKTKSKMKNFNEVNGIPYTEDMITGFINGLECIREVFEDLKFKGINIMAEEDDESEYTS